MTSGSGAAGKKRILFSDEGGGTRNGTPRKEPVALDVNNGSKIFCHENRAAH